MRTSAGWSDACILNVSSRGLLVHAKQSVAEGASIELRHREHVILAQVIWHSGSRVGLQALDWVPVDDILMLSQSPTFQLTASSGRAVEWRKLPGTHEDSRLIGRMIEFASVGIIALALSCGLFSMVMHALQDSMERVRVALDGRP